MPVSGAFYLFFLLRMVRIVSSRSDGHRGARDCLYDFTFTGSSGGYGDTAGAQYPHAALPESLERLIADDTMRGELIEKWFRRTPVQLGSCS